MTSTLILSSPNLNLLGTRQPEVYCITTLGDINAQCRETAETLGIAIAFEYSQHAGQMIDLIHAAKDLHDGIIINAAACTHTSVARYDALVSVELPLAYPLFMKCQKEDL